MSELYHMKLEADALRQAKADAQAQCSRLVEQMKAEAKQEAVRTNTLTICITQNVQNLNLIETLGKPAAGSGSSSSISPDHSSKTMEKHNL